MAEQFRQTAQLSSSLFSLFCGVFPPKDRQFGGTVLPNNTLFGGTVPPNNTLFGGTVPPNSTLFGGTLDFEKPYLISMKSCFG